MLQEILPDMLASTEMFILDQRDITDQDAHKNYFAYADHNDPALRTRFHENALRYSGCRYLFGRYLEDRSFFLAGSHIAREGRTLHLGIDLFSVDQEVVSAPCDGEIVVSAKEAGAHGYGNYLILRPDDSKLPYLFMGHLADDKKGLGRVDAGQQIARLGHWDNYENGGWSVHLHLQLLRELPRTGEAPIGYTSRVELETNKQNFPDPLSLYPGWVVKR